MQPDSTPFFRNLQILGFLLEPAKQGSQGKARGFCRIRRVKSIDSNGVPHQSPVVAQRTPGIRAKKAREPRSGFHTERVDEKDSLKSQYARPKSSAIVSLENTLCGTHFGVPCGLSLSYPGCAARPPGCGAEAFQASGGLKPTLLIATTCNRPCKCGWRSWLEEGPGPSRGRWPGITRR